MMQITPDIFNPSNFVKAGIVNQLLTAPTATNDIGVVTFSTCSDKEGKFTFDEASSSYNPNPMIKGKNVNFDLQGIVSSPMDVSKIHLHVNWNGTPLYDQDYKEGVHFDSSLDIKLSWYVPTYAPNGKYDLTLVGYDSDGVTSDMCVGASFQF